MPPPPTSSSSSAAPSATVLARVFKGMTEGVIVTRPDFGPKGLIIEHLNPALTAMSGYEPAELIGQPHGALHADRKDLPPVRRWLKQSSDAEPLTREGNLKRKDGSLLFVAWTLNGLTDASGNVTQLMITYRDMTANRQLREALIHSQRLDAVGRLAGGVAHDFNNLLSVINGYTEILHHRLGEDSTVQKELLEIHQAGRRAATLVHQLLAFGRRQTMEARVIAPGRLIREHTDILSRLLGEHRSLEMDLAADTGNVHVDPTQLQQVFLNLVLNARDATKEGDRITVSTRNTTVSAKHHRRATDPKPGAYVLLTVADNGIGMTEATRQTLFEPFFTTKGEGKGTGLGLALVYGVVTQSGGYVQVHSELDQGSTFEIYLPRTHEPLDPIRGKLAPLPVTGGRETLLIIEPDTVVRKMIAGILSADGYEVIAESCCSTASIALKRVKTGIHLLIADPMSEDGDVARLARRLHRTQKGVRLLAIPNTKSKPIKDIPAKRQSQLPKPFALSSLLYDVRSLLDAKL
jgi:two-component system, cell cycle sensor histidine kinase and response regulator CckA